ncbi:MFS transporter [Marinimicrobium sp. C2-29]|uniref:MFS transporter n=1 Tax=Marinimicrobium sp. C2-29 TaxID=3139825 RepID=UPI0031392CE4
MRHEGLGFPHPLAFWSGCLLIMIGVVAHVPMFLHSAAMNYKMAGMEMDATMWVGMGVIPLGVLLAWFGLMPRLELLRQGSHGTINFHVADNSPLNVEHWKLVAALLVAVTVDVMKPATLGFVMPGMKDEYGISQSSSGTLALIALTGTAVGSILWGRLADLMGRRAAILLSALMFIGTAICGAMPSFTWNLIMCFLMGLSAGGLLPITFTLMAEVIPAAHRGWLLVALGGIGTAAGYLVASGAAAVLEPLFSWRALWFLGLPTGLIIIFLGRYIPESPRFLANVGLKRQAQAVLNRYNGVLDRDEPEHVEVEEAASEGDKGLKQMLTGPYAPISLGLVGAGLAWGLVNFGFLLWLPTNLRDMGMSPEAANGLLAKSGFLALPGIVAVMWLYHAWSSIKTLVTFIALTALSLLVFFVLGLLSIQSSLAITFATAGLLISASGVIAMLIPYAAEIYPVHLRGTGAGLVAASSKAGGILGAVCGVIGVFSDLAFSALIISVPLLIFGGLLLKNGIDTRGRRLEEIHAAVTFKAASRFSAVTPQESEAT